MAKGNFIAGLFLRLLPLILLIGSVGLFTPTSTATAAASAVTVNGAQFTLSNPVLTPDNGKLSALQFTISLKNNGKGAVKYSDYGVRIVTSGGSNISAKLLVKQTARIAAGESLDYVYTAQVPANLALSQLKAVIFKWDASKANLMKDYGSLPLAGATAAPAAAYTDVSLPLVDAAFRADAVLRLQAEQSYFVHEDGKIYLYTDLYATNKGASDITLPASLLYQLKGSSQSYAASLAFGNGITLQPGEKSKLTVKAQVPADLAAKELKLVFYTSTQTKQLVLGSLSIAGTDKTVAIGTAAAYHSAAGASGITFRVTEATASKQTEGTHVIAKVEVRNAGKTTESIPGLTAAFLFGSAESAPANKDTLSHPAELEAGASTTYYFQYVASGPVDAAKLKLVLLESKENAATTATTAATTATTATTAATAEAEAGAAKTPGATSALPVALISLSGLEPAATGANSYEDYSFGTPFKLPANSTLSAGVEVALMDLRLYENTETGYKTVIGKYKFTNVSQSPVAVPALQTDLIGAFGGVYTGTPQQATIQEIMPSTSYIASYAYILPDKEEGIGYQINIVDDKTLSNERLTLGAYRVALQETVFDRYVPYTLSYYPYQVDVASSDIIWNYISSSDKYTGTLKLILEASIGEKAIVEASQSSLLFELINEENGQTVSSASVSMGGAQKLQTGRLALTLEGIPADVITQVNILRIYEVLETPNGTVKHLLKQM